MLFERRKSSCVGLFAKKTSMLLVCLWLVVYTKQRMIDEMLIPLKLQGKEEKKEAVRGSEESGELEEGGYGRED